MIKIYTFGDFDIRLNNKSILGDIRYQQRIMKLFKYFLTFEGKKILPEIIIEDLWGEKDYNDPLGVLRTQIFRVRRMFDGCTYLDKPFYDIKFINGYYIFKVSEGCRLDFREFETLLNKGNFLYKEDVDEAVLALKEGLSLYRGEYLEELEHEYWLIPIRNRFDRLFLKGLSNQLEELKIRKMYYDIIEIAEKTIEFKPYEELVNYYFIDALMEIGQKKYAINHYEYYTSKLYNDLSIKPSEKIKDLYKRIQNHQDSFKKIINFNILNIELETDKVNEGALICEISCFKTLYNWKIRDKERNKDRNVYLGIFSLDNIGYSTLRKEEIEEGMNLLIEIVYRNLRKNDVLSKWNDSQLVTLFSDVDSYNLNIIKSRLEEKFKEEIDNKDILLNIQFRPL